MRCMGCRSGVLGAVLQAEGTECPITEVEAVVVVVSARGVAVAVVVGKTGVKVVVVEVRYTVMSRLHL